MAGNNAVAFQMLECIAERFPANPANSSLKIAEPLALSPSASRVNAVHVLVILVSAVRDGQVCLSTSQLLR